MKRDRISEQELFDKVHALVDSGPCTDMRNRIRMAIGLPPVEVREGQEVQICPGCGLVCGSAEGMCADWRACFLRTVE